MTDNDFSFPSGTHALTSRESVIQRQMVLSEEQYTNVENFRLILFNIILSLIPIIFIYF